MKTEDASDVNFCCSVMFLYFRAGRVDKYSERVLDFMERVDGGGKVTEIVLPVLELEDKLSVDVGLATVSKGANVDVCHVLPFVEPKEGLAKALLPGTLELS